MEKNTVVYVGNKGFSAQIGVSMYSLFENNTDIAICVFLFTDGIPAEDLEKFQKVALAFNQELHIIDVPPLEELSGTKLYSSKGELWPPLVYTRLFLTELLPKSIHKTLYLDADTVVVDSIKDLFEMNIDQYGASAVLDASNYLKALNGYKRSDGYFNSGVSLLNLDYWRSHDVMKSMVRVINKQHGKSFDGDQTSFNVALKGHIFVLPPCYNFMRRFYVAVDDYENYLKNSGYKKREIYTKEEFASAYKKIRIIHFAGVGNRPWVKGCDNPATDIWRDYLKKTPWKNFSLLDAPEIKQRPLFAKWCRKKIFTNICSIPLLRKIYVRIKYSYWQS